MLSADLASAIEAARVTAVGREITTVSFWIVHGVEDVWAFELHLGGRLILLGYEWLDFHAI